MLNAVKMKTFKITPEDLVESSFFGEGVHEVIITGTDINETSDNRVYIEVEVEGVNGETAKVRQWLHTPDSRRISLNTIRSILVHNIEDQEGKAKLREYFQKIANLNDLNGFLLKLVGYQAWLKVAKSKTRTYTDKETGQVKPSIERNLYGYEPKAKKAEVAETVPTEPEAAPNKPAPVAVEADEHGTAHYSADMSQEVDLSEIPF